MIKIIVLTATHLLAGWIGFRIAIVGVKKLMKDGIIGPTSKALDPPQ